MKYFYTLLLFTVLSFQLQAQSNFKPGYIVTLKGDTTKGLIDYRQWGHRNPDKVTFKNSSGEVTNYAVADVNAFGIDSYESYRTSTISLSQNTLSVGDLVNYVDSSVVKQKVFLRVIVAGEKISLFVFEDALKNRCYVAEGTSTPVELLRYRHISPTDNSKIVDVDTYRQQLQRLAAIYQSSNPLLSKQIQGVFYDEQDLKKIIVRINGTTAVKYVEPNRASLRFYAGLGVAANTMRFTSGEFEPAGSQWSYLPQITAGFDALSNKNASKLVFRLELTAFADRTVFNQQTTVTTTSFAPTTYNYQYTISRFTVGLNPQILYNFYNTKNLKVFAAAGAAAFFSGNSNPESKYSYTQNGKITEAKFPIFIELRDISFVVTTKVGVTVKRLQFYGGYIPATNILRTDLATYKLLTGSYNFGVNYFLGKN